MASDGAPMAAAKPQQTPLDLKELKISVSHQEVERILDEVDQMLETACLPTGRADPGWLPTQAVAIALCEDLGYEDIDELEDALKGSFDDWVDELPHVETKYQPDPHQEGEQRKLFRLKPLDESKKPRPFVVKYKVTSREDLWTVLLKAPAATIEIPEVEFEIGRSQKRQVDALYHHIAKAITNISMHVQQLSHNKMLSPQHEDAYTDTLINLNKLLDVDMPFVVKVIDPSGLSMFKPDDRVETEYTDEAEQAAAQAVAAAKAAKEAPASA